MRAKSDAKPLKWTDVQPRSAGQVGLLPQSALLSPGARSAPPAVSRFSGPFNLKRTPASPEEIRDFLREELSRGRDYLAQVQAELSKNRELLEQWDQYEATCSLRPLDHLVQCVVLKEKVEQFLIGWLQRRQKDLAVVSRQLDPKQGQAKKRRRVRG